FQEPDSDMIDMITTIQETSSSNDEKSTVVNDDYNDDYNGSDKINVKRKRGRTTKVKANQDHGLFQEPDSDMIDMITTIQETSSSNEKSTVVNDDYNDDSNGSDKINVKRPPKVETNRDHELFQESDS